MKSRAKRGVWPVLLMILAVGYFTRGRSSEVRPAAQPPESRPAASLPVTRSDAKRAATQQPDLLQERTAAKAVSREPARSLVARVVGVHDGDTLTGLDDAKTQHKIRLDAIDAPELGQPFGQAAKKALSDKVFGKDVVVVPKKKDRWGRTIGHVMIDGRDVNLEMLEEGMAWHYKHFDKNKRLGEAEQSARDSRKGLWQDREPVPPWVWRKLDKSARGQKRAVSSPEK